MSEIRYSMSSYGIDWTELKQALVDDHFDNERTPAQYRLSHEDSHPVVFARDGGEFVGNGRILSDGVWSGG